jgi:CO/xanthine dehydrogenase FAD-binding subunit
LVPALNMRLVRPATLVDVNGVTGLDDVAAKNGSLSVGALVRQSDSRLLRHPLLAEALPHVGHFVTRNRGTVAGSIAHADPAAELPLCLLLLGGTVLARSVRSEREIPAAELLVETRWPTPQPGWGHAFVEFTQRRGDYALCMAAAAVGSGEVRVALGSVVERPTLLEVDPDNAGASAASQVEPWGTVHASPAYLVQLVRVLVERAVERARKRAAA